MLKINNMLIGVVASALLVGCGSSSDSSSTSNLTGETVEITSETAAANTLASLSSVQSQTETSFTNLAPSRNSPARVQSLRAPSLTAVNFTDNCTYGGTLSISGDESADGSYSGTMTYSNCDEGSVMNGSVSISGTETDDGTKTTWTDTTTMSNFTLTSDSMNMNINMSISSEEWWDYTTDDEYWKDTISGTMAVNYDVYTLNLGYDNFITSESYVSSTAITTKTIDGKMSYQDSASSCANGIYEFETISPLTSSYSGYTGGVVKINGATFSFNSDGTANITYADGNTSTNVQPNSSVICN